MSILLSEESLECLRFARRKTLASVEYFTVCGSNIVFGEVLVNFSHECIKITNAYDEVLFFDEKEEGGVLSCSLAPKERHRSYAYASHPYSGAVRRYLIGEKVTSVEVVREHDFDPEDGCTFDMDAVIAFRTPYRLICFSRDCWSNADFAVDLSLPPDADLVSVARSQDRWIEDADGSDGLRVTREVIVL